MSAMARPRQHTAGAEPPAAPAARLERALAPVAGGLAEASDRMLAALADPVARKVVYLITAGGKRLRPALVLLAGTAGPAPRRPDRGRGRR